MLNWAFMTPEPQCCEKIVSDLTCASTLAVGVEGGDGTGVEG